MNDSRAVIRLAVCPACGTKEFEALPLPRRWIGGEIFEAHREALGLSRCACGLVFVNPRPTSQLLAQFYGGRSYECHRANAGEASREKARFVLDRVLEHAPHVRRLLDYGCGGGFLLRQARARRLHATGFDIGAEAQRVCRRQGLEVATALSQLEPGSFDAVVLHHVFEHLPDPLRTLGDLCTLLAPGGAVFLEVPNAASLRAQLALPRLTRRLPFDERYRAFPIHLWYFEPATLVRLLVAGGMSVTALETYGLGLDELLIRESESSAVPTLHPPASKKLLPSALRTLTKRWLYGAGLGENLLAVARPRRAASSSAGSRSNPHPMRRSAT